MAVALALIITIVLTLWVVWVALTPASASVQGDDIGHQIVDDRTVDVSFRVSKPHGRAVACAVEAQDEAHGAIGWRVVEIPASDPDSVGRTVRVTTTAKPVTGLLYSCWIP